jgi:hypothetical protein
MFGPFSRDRYYPGYGSPADGEYTVFPWVKEAHCHSDTTSNLVCAPGDLIFLNQPEGCTANSRVCKLF